MLSPVGTSDPAAWIHDAAVGAGAGHGEEADIVGHPGVRLDDRIDRERQHASRRTAEVVGELADVAAVDDVVLFGGAARMELLVDRVASLTGRPVRVGSAEAAALGNAIAQGIAIGSFASLAEGRSKIGTLPNPQTPNSETPNVENTR